LTCLFKGYKIKKKNQYFIDPPFAAIIASHRAFMLLPTKHAANPRLIFSHFFLNAIFNSSIFFNLMSSFLDEVSQSGQNMLCGFKSQGFAQARLPFIIEHNRQLWKLVPSSWNIKFPFSF
jgi:hypothetical protein